MNKLRDKKAEEYIRSEYVLIDYEALDNFKSGWNACAAIYTEREKVLVGALEKIRFAYGNESREIVIFKMQKEAGDALKKRKDMGK